MRRAQSHRRLPLSHGRRQKNASRTRRISLRCRRSMLAQVAARASRTASRTSRFRSLRTLCCRAPHDQHGVPLASPNVTGSILGSKPPSALQRGRWIPTRYSSNFVRFDPEMSSLKAPQPPPVWKHTPEEVKKLTEEVIARVRSIYDEVAGVEPDKCDFDSVRLL